MEVHTMFETLFSYPAVLRRHQDGPLAVERSAYLDGLAARGTPRGTLLRRASYCLCIAREFEQRQADHVFDTAEIEGVARAWAAQRTAEGRAGGPRWPEEHFRFAATDFLRAIGRYRAPPPAASGRYDRQLDDFIAVQREGHWLSEATCRSARWQLTRFLEYLDQQGVALGEVEPRHVDAYLQHMAPRWSRISLHTSARMLRPWFAHCERHGWVRSGVATAILLPRIYRHEGLPLGPTWDEVGRMLGKTVGDAPSQLRDHAILQLLAVYGLRSGEVRRLAIEDLDWHRGRVRVVRSKSSREETLPIEPSVGNAIARYLRYGRPASTSRIVFLTLRAPYRPLSTSGLYDVVHRYLSQTDGPSKGRGPHGLRHACARHLVETGRSFKEVGDHLGHRSPDATRLYAKVDLASLRRVALSDLGGLS
jgi:site-specific recombinase XerD